jgi:hypothetical protein
MWPDAINAAFELVGAFLNWTNVRRLMRDKKVRGVYWPAWAFFALWGWWNLLYYGPFLGQWLSGAAGIIMVIANTTWVVLAIKYRRN